MGLSYERSPADLNGVASIFLVHGGLSVRENSSLFEIFADIVTEHAGRRRLFILTAFAMVSVSELLATIS